MATALEHHTIFHEFPCYTGKVPAGFDINFVGTLIRDHLWNGIPRNYPAREVRTYWPALDNEEYFEWICLLAAVAEAENRFTMIELGAGWGRWMLSAASAVRRFRRIPFRLIGVEAEPAHFNKMRQCFVDNDLALSDHKLLQAAVHDKAGSVRFSTPGDTPNSYGQAVLADPPEETWFQRLRRVARGLPHRWTADRSYMTIPAITLNGLLEETPELIDLIDADIQGAEGRVFEAGAELVDRKVKRVFIGTHPNIPGVEDRVRGVFRSLAWENVYDFGGMGRRSTPYGEIEFRDGVQVWVNPRLVTRCGPLRDQMGLKLSS